MKDKPGSNGPTERGALIQFTLAGLIVFTVCLVLVVAMVTFALVRFLPRNPGDSTASVASNGTHSNPDAAPIPMAPWGELQMFDLELEPPEEYLAFDLE